MENFSIGLISLFRFRPWSRVTRHLTSPLGCVTDCRVHYQREDAHKQFSESGNFKILVDQNIWTANHPIILRQRFSAANVAQSFGKGSTLGNLCGAERERSSTIFGQQVDALNYFGQ